MSRGMLYLSMQDKFDRRLCVRQSPVTLLPMHPVPCVGWILGVYVRDACTRIDETRARVTSIFGEILKMDSTKKASFLYNGFYYAFFIMAFIMTPVKPDTLAKIANLQAQNPLR